MLSLAGLLALAVPPLTGQAQAVQVRPVTAHAEQPYPVRAPALQADPVVARAAQPYPDVARAAQCYPDVARAAQPYPDVARAAQPYPVMARAGAPSTSLPFEIGEVVDGRATPGHDGKTPAGGSVARPVGEAGLAHTAQPLVAQSHTARSHTAQALVDQALSARSLLVLAQAQPAPIVTAPLPPLQATPDQPSAPQPTAPATPDLPARPNLWLARPVAIIQALDKVNAQSAKLTIKVGQQATYESLTIAVRACVVRPPDQAADAAAFLVITDSHKDGPGFSGWMDHADPSLSMLEHPLYDVRVLGCGGG